MKTTTAPYFVGLVMLGLLAIVFCSNAMIPLAADEPAAADEKPSEGGTESKAEPGKPFGPPPGAKRLDPKSSIWFDPKKKIVLVDGYVCLREGQLEMFA